MKETTDKNERKRADELLVLQGLSRSRSHARDLIKRGFVRLPDGSPIDKPSRSCDVSLALHLLNTVPDYVSRAGEKLHAYLQHSGLTDLSGYNVLDLGASTGGFTQCTLRHGANHVTCLDVGHGQLAESVASDPRIKNLEGYNARELSSHTLPHSTYTLVTLDLSFISIRLVAPEAWKRVTADGYMIALIKPQFEAGPDKLGPGGILRNDSAREQIVDSLRTHLLKTLPNSQIHNECPSPICGGDGNREHLLGFHKKQSR